MDITNLPLSQFFLYIAHQMSSTELASFANTPIDQLALHRLTWDLWLCNAPFAVQDKLYHWYSAQGIIAADDISIHSLRLFHAYLRAVLGVPLP